MHPAPPHTPAQRGGGGGRVQRGACDSSLQLGWSCCPRPSDRARPVLPPKSCLRLPVAAVLGKATIATLASKCPEEHNSAQGLLSSLTVPEQGEPDP